MSLDVSLLYTCVEDNTHTVTVYDANITHNLGKMARLIGVYDACWRPDENGFERAEDISGILEGGLIYMAEHPDECRALNPENGWGDDVGFKRWLVDYLRATLKYPKARIRAHG